MTLSNCVWCNEPMLPEDRNPAIPFLDTHTPCGFRMIMGSLAHLQGRCACFIDGAGEGDPPEMTLRQAAAAAYEYWHGLTVEERLIRALGPVHDD